MEEIVRYLKGKNCSVPEHGEYACLSNADRIDLTFHLFDGKVSAVAAYRGLQEVVLPNFRVRKLDDFKVLLQTNVFIQNHFPSLIEE